MKGRTEKNVRIVKVEKREVRGKSDPNAPVHLLLAFVLLLDSSFALLMSLFFIRKVSRKNIVFERILESDTFQ